MMDRKFLLNSGIKEEDVGFHCKIRLVTCYTKGKITRDEFDKALEMTKGDQELIDLAFVLEDEYNSRSDDNPSYDLRTARLLEIFPNAYTLKQ